MEIGDCILWINTNKYGSRGWGWDGVIEVPVFMGI